MRSTITLFVFWIFLAPALLFAQKSYQQKSDSIEVLLPSLQGKERVDALSELCEYVYHLGDSLREQKCWKQLWEEANSIGDTQTAGRAYRSLMICYFNFNNFACLEAELPDALAYQLKIGNLEYYYAGRSLLVEMYLFQDKNYSALQEMQAMYQDAQERGSVYGQAVSLYKIGVSYIQIYLDADPALDAFKRSLELFALSDDISILELDAYYDYCNILYQVGQTTELQQALARWKKRLDKANAISEKENGTTLFTKYAYYYSEAIYPELLLGNKTRAAQYLDSMDRMIAHCSPTIQNLVLDTRENYFKSLGEYDSALVYNWKRIQWDEASGLSALATNEMRLRGNLFYLLKRYDSAAHNFYKFNLLRDSVETGLNANLLNEFHTLFKVNELKAAQRLLYNRILLLSLAIALLATIVLLLVVYTRRLRKKNRSLYDVIQNDLRISKARKRQIEILKQENPHYEELPRDVQIYNRLCRLMQEKQLFCDPNCSNVVLANELGTNRTYLAEAVKIHENGATVLEYINGLRLEYAAQLLSSPSSLRISDVEIMVGFNSRSTFYRLFKEKYGLSATEYQNIAEEKRKEQQNKEESEVSEEN